MAFSFHVGSVRATVMNFNNLQVAGTVAVRKCLNAAGSVWKADLMKNITYHTHTLQQLADMDHPYAKRHGSIQIHPDRPYVVHERQGRLTRTVSGKVMKGKLHFYRLKFDGRYKLPRFIVKGTKTMLPRDVITETGNQPETRKRMMKAIIDVLGKDLRAGAVIRFHPRTMRFR